MKNLLTLSLLIISTIGMTFSQKVDLKKGIVYFDKQPVYSYDREMMGNITNLYRLNTSDMIMTISFENNGTINYTNDDYIRIFFYEFNVLIETGKLRGMWPKQILERMRKMGVIENNGVFNPMKVENFRMQYHEEYIRIR